MNAEDSEEIDQFSRLAKEFWQEKGAFAALHHINPARLEFIENHKMLPQAKVLDIGCGGGILSESMALLGADVLGIDLSAAVLEEARTHAKSQGVNVEYRLCDSAAILGSECFDLITCTDMLEHITQPQKVIADISRLLKHDGYAVLSTLNRNLWSNVLAISIAEHILRIVPPGTHRYERFIRPHELIDMAQACGLRAVDLKGIAYNPFSKTAHLIRRPRINYILALYKA